MFLKPAGNPLASQSGQPPYLKVRDPDLHDYLPVEGRKVLPSEYWIRRLRDKDVVEVPESTGATTDATTSAPSDEATTVQETETVVSTTSTEAVAAA